MDDDNHLLSRPLKRHLCMRRGKGLTKGSVAASLMLLQKHFISSIICQMQCLPLIKNSHKREPGLYGYATCASYVRRALHKQIQHAPSCVAWFEIWMEISGFGVKFFKISKFCNTCLQYYVTQVQDDTPVFNNTTVKLLCRSETA
jgi:hypothetical protein